MENKYDRKQISFTSTTDGIADLAEKATDGTEVTLLT